MLQEIISDLTNTDKATRDRAMDRLRTATKEGEFGIGEAVAMIRAACAPYPVEENEFSAGPRDWLIWMARDVAAQHREDARDVLHTIEETFPMLAAKQRTAALQILTFVGGPEAVALYVRLVKGARGQLDGRFLPTFDATKSINPQAAPPLDEETAGTLFPAVLEAVDDFTAAPIYLMLLECLKARLLPGTVLGAHEPPFLAAMRQQFGRISALQQESRPGNHNWKYEDPYAPHRHTAGVMMDLSGWLDSAGATVELRRARDLTDPWLRHFRAISLLRRGERPEPGELDWLARSPRERYWLHDHLLQMGFGDDLPDLCRDQTKLAEGHMVDWLCFGTELAREPDEIELVHVETKRVSRGWLRRAALTDYYFFRYRVTEEHWSRKDGWMVGMAGGYLRTPGGTTEHDGGTFSQFHSWESKSLAEHVADYLG